MNRDSSRGDRPDYGIDAPDVVIRFAFIGILGIIVGAAALFASIHHWMQWTRWVVLPAGSIGGTFLAQAAIMLWGSKVGKLRLRDQLVRSIPWRGDERVLDVGCGHGLLLIAAARQLRDGKAVGIDLWKKEDQAGNSREATFRNAEIEGVADKVDLKDGDARRLPFPDSSFDVVLSSWALHNIYDPIGRRQAILEIVRTLKPGGRVILVDIRHIPEYARVLTENQFVDIKKSGPNFLFVIPSYWLMAVKP